MRLQDSRQIYSISEINNFAKQTLEQIELWVEGEISSFEENPSWFNSFITLADDTSLLACFLKPPAIEKIKDQIIGKHVIAYGRLTLFRKNQYKLEIFSIEQTGEGILQKRFENLYKKLKTEGLFDQKHKKAIPQYPKKVCIITSNGSAGWNDFKHHTVDKFPIIELITADVRVEGERAITQLLEIIPKIDQMGFDIIVITRGGGASETLLEVFNDETIARTIFKMKTPKIIAIGHEVNTSLSELVADCRASTPTDAANIVTQGYSKISDKLSYFNLRFNSSRNRLFSENGQLIDSIYFRLNQIENKFKNLPHRLNTLKESLKRHEKHLIADVDTSLNRIQRKIKAEARLFLLNIGRKLEAKKRDLNLLSPMNTLERGYSITYDEKGRIVTTVENIVVGSTIGVRLSDGSLKSVVKSKSINA